MVALKKNLRICSNGHKYYKSSDCPVCPVCEKQRKPVTDFLSGLSSPARRALENNGINTLVKLSKLSEAEVLSFHGMGKASIPVLQMALAAKGLAFKKK